MNNNSQSVQQTGLTEFSKFMIEEINSYQHKRDGWQDGTVQFEAYDLVVRELHKISEKYISLTYYEPEAQPKGEQPVEGEIPYNENIVKVLQEIKAGLLQPEHGYYNLWRLFNRLATSTDTTPPASAPTENRFQILIEKSKNNSSCSIAWDKLDFSKVYNNYPYGIKVSVNEEGKKQTGGDTVWRVSPKWEVGDILWVRESWAQVRMTEIFSGKQSCSFVFKAGRMVTSSAKNTVRSMLDGTAISEIGYGFDRNPSGKWKPSIHMPKEACRLRLEITDIKGERLQDISEADAKEEGAACGILLDGPNTEKMEYHFEVNHMAKYKDGFRFIWQNINGRESWNNNPIVWVLKFQKI